MATDRRRLERARMKADRAVHLRVAGRQTYQQIADALMPCPEHKRVGGAEDCTDCERMYAGRAAAHKAVTRALADDRQAGEETRQLARDEHLSTLDVLLRRSILDAISTTNSPSDRARAITAAARVLDQRAKVLGLYAPTKVEVTTELDLAIADELAAMAALDPIVDGAVL